MGFFYRLLPPLPLHLLFCCTTGTGLHHLLWDSFRYGQNEQLAALLTLWLANPCWSLLLFSLHVIELSLCKCQVWRKTLSRSDILSFCPGPSFMCPAHDPGGIWAYVNNLMRSKVRESNFYFSQTFLFAPSTEHEHECSHIQDSGPASTFQ